MSAIATAILALLQQLLPLITTGSASSGVTATVVNLLTTWLPLITTEVTALYGPVKSILATLQGSGALTAQQISDLKASETLIDQAFIDASAGLDPDAPATA